MGRFFKSNDNNQKERVKEKPKENYEYIEWQAQLSRISDDRYNIYDNITLENTKQNKNVAKKADPGPIAHKKSLGFKLEENVTYSFNKNHTVKRLLNP